ETVCSNEPRAVFTLAHAATARSMVTSTDCAPAIVGAAAVASATNRVLSRMTRLTRRPRRPFRDAAGAPRLGLARYRGRSRSRSRGARLRGEQTVRDKAIAHRRKARGPAWDAPRR